MATYSGRGTTTGGGVAHPAEHNDAFLYGAGLPKLGSIIGKTPGAMSKVKTSFLRKFPALRKLIDAVKKVAAGGTVGGLDGRRVPARSQHSALNTLLQSAGAIVMKKALVILDQRLQEAGLVPGMHYEFMLNVHDEFQLEVAELHATFVGEQAVASIKAAGEFFNMRCPLDGEYRIGSTWADTH